jgi:hypothetical protein
MEEAADDPSLDGSNKESAESNASTDAAMDGNGGGDNLSVDSKLALLQEVKSKIFFKFINQFLL